MSAHTPGPWAYRPSNSGHFIAGAGENSGYLAEVRQCRSKQDVRADARLIAAAPDLLAALRDVVGWVPGPTAFFTDGSDAAIKRARAAIAKAEGRE